MRRSATTLAAVGATALAVLPANAAGALHDDPPSPTDRELAAPLAGHLTVGEQMRSVHVRQLERRAARRRAERRAAHRRAERRAHRRAAARAATTAVTPPHLAAIAACESGGNPSTNTGNGFYGKYQFTQQTWASVGGTGNPAAASEAEQDRRAALLYARTGGSAWPVCGR